MNPRKRSALLAILCALAGSAVLSGGTWFFFEKASNIPMPQWLYIGILFGVLFTGYMLWAVGDTVKPKSDSRAYGLQAENRLVRSFKVLWPWKSLTYNELFALSGILGMVVCFGMIENYSIWIEGLLYVVLIGVITSAVSFYKQQASA